MNTVTRNLLNILIDQMSPCDQMLLIDDLTDKMDPAAVQEMIDQAEEIYRLKRNMVERMDTYRASPAWPGCAVDRQGGSFTQDELNDTGWH